jgi:hypothetical protein
MKNIMIYIKIIIVQLVIIVTFCNKFSYAQEENKWVNPLKQNPDSTQTIYKKSVPAIISSDGPEAKEKEKEVIEDNVPMEEIQDFGMYHDARNRYWDVSTDSIIYHDVSLVNVTKDNLIITSNIDRIKIPVDIIKDLRCLKCDSSFKPEKILLGTIAGVIGGIVAYFYVYSEAEENDKPGTGTFSIFSIGGGIVGFFVGISNSTGHSDAVYKLDENDATIYKVNQIRTEIFGMKPLNKNK